MSPPRDDVETTSDLACPVCGTGFTRIRRQRYCSPACRQAAWRTRQPATPTAPTHDPVRARPGGRREITVYVCPDCDQRSLGEQWCHDCNRPRTRVGFGGSCPSCDEPVALDDLLDTHHDHLTAPSRENQASINPGAVQ